MSARTEDYWRPLESLLGRDRCVGFMFMGRLSNGINQYKHESAGGTYSSTMIVCPMNEFMAAASGESC